MKSTDYMPRSGMGRLYLTLPAKAGFPLPMTMSGCVVICMSGNVHSGWSRWNYREVLICISLMLRVRSSPFDFLFWEHSVKFYSSFSNWIVWVLMFRFFFPVDWLVWIPTPCQMYNWQSFYFHILWMPFPWLAVSLTIQRLLWIHEFPFVNCWSYLL